MPKDTLGITVRISNQSSAPVRGRARAVKPVQPEVTTDVGVGSMPYPQPERPLLKFPRAAITASLRLLGIPDSATFRCRGDSRVQNFQGQRRVEVD